MHKKTCRDEAKTYLASLMTLKEIIDGKIAEKGDVLSAAANGKVTALIHVAPSLKQKLRGMTGIFSGLFRYEENLFRVLPEAIGRAKRAGEDYLVDVAQSPSALVKERLSGMMAGTPPSEPALHFENLLFSLTDISSLNAEVSTVAKTAKPRSALQVPIDRTYNRLDIQAAVIDVLWRRLEENGKKVIRQSEIVKEIDVNRAGRYKFLFCEDLELTSDDAKKGSSDRNLGEILRLARKRVEAPHGNPPIASDFWSKKGVRKHKSSKNPAAKQL